jgi:hypothetical protein
LPFAAVLDAVLPMIADLGLEVVLPSATDLAFDTDLPLTALFLEVALTWHWL